MNSLRDSVSFYGKSVYLLLLISTVVNADQGDCDKTKCPGPLRYYKDLRCEPIFKNPGDCCAIKYDCKHLAEMSKEKCYVNGKPYEIGQKMNNTDANSCDFACVCRMGHDNIASFICAVVDCPHFIDEGCFLRNSPKKCCGEQICLKPGEERATCIVDGKTYFDGQYFSLPGDPDVSCTCQPGFNGTFAEPFCAKPNHPYCSPEIRHANDIHNNCAPVYYDNQSPQTDCSVFSRCQDTKDVVIDSSDSKNPGVLEEANDQLICDFGTLKMRTGEELNQNTNTDCIKCVCEVPPTPTCRRLPTDECKSVERER